MYVLKAYFGSAVFAYYAPKLYKYYCDILSSLFQHDPHLRRIYTGTVFPIVTLNVGPQVVSTLHRDQSNLADGLCWILASGSYNPALGGHLVLWELGIVVEFPPGSSVLIPSAVISHGNVPVQAGETRSSITQYASGGLFRWVEHGFQKWDALKVEDYDLAMAMKDARSTRWQETVSRYSMYELLAADRREVFST